MTTNKYASKTEEKAAALLIPEGFTLTSNTYLRGTFVDKKGESFRAMADFSHPELPGIHIEIKDNSLNEKTFKAAAERAVTKAVAWNKGRTNTGIQVKNGWNHSAIKQSITQEAQFSIGECLLIVFMQKPTPRTLERLKEHDIVWTTIQDLIKWSRKAQVITAFSGGMDWLLNPP